MLKELDRIYYETGYAFPMIISHLFDIGFRTAMSITDEDIAELEGNGLMTQDFVQDLVRYAREIAHICGGDPIYLVMFCQKKKLFDVNNLK